MLYSSMSYNVLAYSVQSCPINKRFKDPNWGGVTKSWIVLFGLLHHLLKVLRF